MNAMILAAGRGERMRPLTDERPKPLLDVCGKALIVYHLEALKRAGVESVVINVCWLGDQIKEALGDGHQFGLSIIYSEETEALETAGGIVHALDKLDDQFIVVNGDVYTDYEFSDLLNLEKPAHLVMVPNPKHNPEGDFVIKHGLLCNKPGQSSTYSGISCFQKSFFIHQKPGRSALAPLLRIGAQKKQLSAELYQGLWSDVGTIGRLQRLQQHCAEGL